MYSGIGLGVWEAVGDVGVWADAFKPWVGATSLSLSAFGAAGAGVCNFKVDVVCVDVGDVDGEGVVGHGWSGF